MKESCDLAPLVREMVASHGDYSTLEDSFFDSPGSPDPRVKMWKEFVKQRDTGGQS